MVWPLAIAYVGRGGGRGTITQVSQDEHNENISFAETYCGLSVGTRKGTGRNPRRTPSWIRLGALNSVRVGRRQADGRGTRPRRRARPRLALRGAQQSARRATGGGATDGGGDVRWALGGAPGSWHLRGAQQRARSVSTCPPARAARGDPKKWAKKNGQPQSGLPISVSQAGKNKSVEHGKSLSRS